MKTAPMWCAAFAWLACWPGAVRAADEPAGPRPNVVLIMADDLGYGDVGFNGGAVIRTSHLDKMASSGLVFRRFYAASAVCSPTRGSCLTGRHPDRYGIHHANVGHMKPQEITLAELLRERGYATGHFGKWHLGTLTTTLRDANRGRPGDDSHFAPPWQHGFERCFSTESKVPTYDPMLKPAKGADGRGWDAIADDQDVEAYGTRYFDERGEVVEDNLRGDDSRVIMDRAVPFIEQAARAGRPFFAVVWFHTPHLPVVADAAHVKPYAEHGAYAARYYGCVTAMDEQIGRLRATLRELGVADDTIVVVASDNGPEGNAKAPGSAGELRGRKRDLYEGGVRVPAIIEWPARVKPGVTDYPAVTSDYLPTVLDALGMQMPDDRPLDGVSLLPLLDGQRTERHRPIGFRFGKHIAMCDNRHKLISPDIGKTWELYDLVADPGETNDLADARPLVVKRMRVAVEHWLESCRRSAEGADYP